METAIPSFSYLLSPLLCLSLSLCFIKGRKNSSRGVRIMFLSFQLIFKGEKVTRRPSKKKKEKDDCLLLKRHFYLKEKIVRFFNRKYLSRGPIVPFNCGSQKSSGDNIGAKELRVRELGPREREREQGKYNRRGALPPLSSSFFCSPPLFECFSFSNEMMRFAFDFLVRKHPRFFSSFLTLESEKTEQHRFQKLQD